MTLAVKDATGATVNLSTYVDGASEHNPRHSIITAEGAGATIGTTADAAVITNTTGTLSGKIRGIIAILLDVVGTAADAVAGVGSTGSLSAKIRQMSTDIGASADAIVSSASTATISSRIRHISSVIATLNTNAGSTATSTANTDTNTSNAATVLGNTADAAITTNTTGTLSGKLRGIIQLLIDLKTNIALTTSTANIGNVGLTTYTSISTGERQGSATAVQLPTVTAKLVMVKASYDNAGRVYLGISGVTKADGTTDTTTGIQLQPGEMTPWIPTDNLNRMYIICDNAGDDITYMVLA